jgi:hypothetical protein
VCFERVSCEYLLRGDGSLCASSAEERDCPVEKDGEAVLEAGQRREVNKEPKHPRGKAGDAQPAKRRDRAQLRDRRHGPEVAVAEWPAHHLTREAANDRVRGVAAGLDRDLRHSRQLIEAHEVADHEHLGMSRNRAVGFDPDPTGSIELDARRFSENSTERRSFDTSSPDFRRSINPPRLRLGRVRIDALLVDAGDHRADTDLDSHASQVSGRALPERFRKRGQYRHGGVEQDDARFGRIDVTEVPPQRSA